MKRRFRATERMPDAANSAMPKYTIGVVSRLLGLHPQMLRRYEGLGILAPARQSGKNRLYSDEDVAVLEEVVDLYEQGVNAAGIRYIIQIHRHVRVLQQEIQEAREAQSSAEQALNEFQKGRLDQDA